MEKTISLGQDLNLCRCVHFLWAYSTYVVYSISFRTFFGQAFKIVETLENSVCYCYTSYKMTDQFLWFQVQMNSPTKAWLSQLVNFRNAIWTWGHFRRAICNKKSALNLEEMPQKRMEFFKLLLDHLSWVERQFLSGTRDSRKAGSLCGMMRGVGRIRKSIHQSWLTKGLGLGLLCWGFMGVQ